MTIPTELWQLLAMAVLVLLAAVFSASETALFSLSRGQLHAMGRDPHRRRRRVPLLMRRPGAVLATVLLGSTLVNVLYFVTGTLLMLRLQQQGRHVLVAVAGAGTLLGMLLLGEVLPKTLAVIWATWLAPLAAPVISAVGRLVLPAERVLSILLVEPLARLAAPRRARGGDLTAEEVDSLLALSQKRGLIGQDESELLQEVLELTDLRAAEVMAPRVRITAYPIDGSPEGLLDLARQTRLSKIPLYQGDLDEIVGLVYVRRLLGEPNRPPRELMTPIQFVPESAPLERVLLQFRATRSSLAIVVDEYGGTAGLISLEDVLEEIVGDIAGLRQREQAPAVQPVGPAEWLVEGELPIHEWAELFPAVRGHNRVTTIGGFVTAQLGRIARVGDSVSYRNLLFVVEAMRRRRIALLRVLLRRRRA